jgi:hypothetical protein
MCTTKGITLANIDRKASLCYNELVMKNITQTIKIKYYTYQPGEFFPVYSGGELLNKREFHKYRIGWIVRNHRAAVHQFTHFSG